MTRQKRAENTKTRPDPTLNSPVLVRMSTDQKKKTMLYSESPRISPLKYQLALRVESICTMDLSQIPGRPACI